MCGDFVCVYVNDTRRGQCSTCVSVTHTPGACVLFPARLR